MQYLHAKLPTHTSFPDRIYYCGIHVLHNMCPTAANKHENAIGSREEQKI